MSDTPTHSASFVRKEMLAEESPPVTETGILKWLRENLFSSIPNGIMTVLSIFVIYWILSHILPWMVNGIWEGNSLKECREIRDATLGEGHHVACWSVLVERWPQLLYGFYPQGAYWRPNLALVVLFGALAPVLFAELPRKLLFFTLAAPFLIYFLVFGGSIGGPIAVALGFVLGWAAMTYLPAISGSLVATLAAIVVPIVYWLVLAGPIGSALSFLPSLEQVDSKDFGGFMLAVIIGTTGIIVSLPLGVALALGRQSDLFIINKSCVLFIEIIRGVPLIVWLFTASLLLNYFLPPGTEFDILLRVIIMVTLFSAAYIAEVIRGGLAALPRGQYEGADSLGLDYWQSMQLIILPQALKISIPGIVNTFIGLFKDTTLVVFIGLLDPLKGVPDAIRANTEWQGIYWELFIFVGILFFICCYGMSRYSQYLEQKLRTDHR